ncbi:hypothetical protein ACFFP0_29530, partial [Rhizobium puerariae]
KASFRPSAEGRNDARDKRNSKSMKGVSSSFRLRGQIFTSLDSKVPRRSGRMRVQLILGSVDGLGNLVEGINTMARPFSRVSRQDVI